MSEGNQDCFVFQRFFFFVRIDDDESRSGGCDAQLRVGGFCACALLARVS